MEHGVAIIADVLALCKESSLDDTESSNSRDSSV